MDEKKFDYQNVAGDYQYRAMLHGLPMQRFWHKGKLIFWDEVIAPLVSNIDSTGPVMEVGCGAGVLLQHLASWHQIKVGLDVNFQALTFLTGRFNEMGASGSFSPVDADGLILPFKNNSIGGLLISEVIEHLVAPQVLMKEAGRVLQPGGWCYLTTPNYKSPWPYMEKLLDWLRLTPPIAGAQHVTQFDFPSLQNLAADWEILKITSFYRTSPFIAILSESQAIRSLVRECHADLKDGMLISCLLRKPV